MYTEERLRNKTSPFSLQLLTKFVALSIAFLSPFYIPFDSIQKEMSRSGKIKCLTHNPSGDWMLLLSVPERWGMQHKMSVQTSSVRIAMIIVGEPTMMRVINRDVGARAASGWPYLLARRPTNMRTAQYSAAHGFTDTPYLLFPLLLRVSYSSTPNITVSRYLTYCKYS